MVDITLGVISGTSTAMVDISDDCIQFIVTGTVQMRDITVIDHYEDVSVTGSIGHITFHPYMASSFAPTLGLIRQCIPNDDEINHTLKNVTELEPHLIDEYSTGNTALEVSITANMIWSAFPGVSTIRRDYIHCPDLEPSNFTIPNSDDIKLVAVNDRTVFVTYYNTLDSKQYLSRIDFSELIGATGILTELYSFDDTDTYNGETYEIGGGVSWIIRCKYDIEGIDKIAFVSDWVLSLGGYPEIGRLTVWDLHSGTVSYDDFFDLSSAGTDEVEFNALPFYAPGIYNHFIVFAASVAPGNEVGAFCPCPVYRYNCQTNAFVGGFGYTIDASDSLGSVQNGGVISKLSGYYYICFLDTHSVYNLIKSEPNNSLALFQSGEDNYALLQSETNAYAVYDGSIRKLSNFNSSLCAVTDDWPIVIDERNQIAWTYNDDELVGKSLVSLADKTIAINWAGGTTPYDYVNHVSPYYFAILCGNLVMNVYSFSGSPLFLTQNDYYVLAYV